LAIPGFHRTDYEEEEDDDEEDEWKGCAAPAKLVSCSKNESLT